MSLVGSDGDLLDFIPGIINRTNTPGVYQDLVTRNGGGSHGCPVWVNRKSDGLVIANYSYDALNRRKLKTISNGGLATTLPNGTWTYLYDGAQVVEEIENYTTAQYVWGQYVDELIQLNAVSTLGPQSLPAGKYYLLSDLLYRSVALTNSTGAVVEAYDTDAYGNTLLFSGPGTDGLWFTNDDVQAAYSACRYVFTGRECDAETALCFYRRRYYHPYLGRFLGRGPVGYRAGTNLYGYVRANPVVKVDPSGLACFALSSGAGGLGLGSAAGDTLAGGTLAAGETLTAGEALAGGLEIAGLVDAGSGVINPVGAVAAGVIVVGAIGLAAYLYFRDSSPAVPAPCPTVRIPRPPAILDPTIPALVLMCALLFEMKPGVFEGGRQPPPGHYDEDLFCIDCECKIQDTEVLLHLGPMLADECDAAPVVLGWMLIETCDCVPLLLG
jgi:RHS repeat-associated protein